MIKMADIISMYIFLQIKAEKRYACFSITQFMILSQDMGKRGRMTIIPIGSLYKKNLKKSQKKFENFIKKRKFSVDKEGGGAVY